MTYVCYCTNKKCGLKITADYIVRNCWWCWSVTTTYLEGLKQS